MPSLSAGYCTTTYHVDRDVYTLSISLIISRECRPSGTSATSRGASQQIREGLRILTKHASGRASSSTVFSRSTLAPPSPFPCLWGYRASLPVYVECRRRLKPLIYMYHRRSNARRHHEVLVRSRSVAHKSISKDCYKTVP